MRLEPSDKPMYHRMDQRDRALIMIPVFGIAASLGLFFLAARFPAIIGGPFIGLGVCGMFGGAIRYWKLKQMIMPLRGCCLEIQTSCFVARQPWKKEHYEQCRIYFKEVQALIREAKVGGFYLQIPEGGESEIRGFGENRRCLFYVSPFGYPEDKMQAMYQTIKERLPETAEIYEYET